MYPFEVWKPKGSRLPILISCPHAGTRFPNEIEKTFKSAVVQKPKDTDWRIHELYSFAPRLGITVLSAVFSRYVIDLNRDPESRALYNDGRKETSLVPLRSFDGEVLYQKEGPTKEEIERRKKEYYFPYHRRLELELKELKEEFPHVLLYEAHSIARLVPSIRKDPFPDLMLGDNDGRSADSKLTKVALDQLKSFKVSLNDPFRGGYLTRYFGKPKLGIHALQLERSQDIYLDEKCALSPKAETLRPLLEKNLLALAEVLRTLK